MSQSGLQAAQAKMREAGLSPAAIASFTRFYSKIETAHATGDADSVFIRETDIDPLLDLPQIDPAAAATEADFEALRKTALIKLNGGLGTSMGMSQAKSLLPVRPDPESNDSDSQMLSFLDITVLQVLAARARSGARLPLIFMDSFRTQHDSLAALAKYPNLTVAGLPLDFLQNKVPKLDASNLSPITWPQNPELEWCPPGHGDLYPALHGLGLVDTLLEAGYRYLFVSNADNLGATPDPKVAGWFAASKAPYAAEMCLKTPADVKGGQLVIRKSDGQLIQRETAQTHPDDMEVSLDPTKHKYFHTNNLWFNLEALAAELHQTNGALDLPLIQNVKTVDPANPDSPQVFQLESAMGAAVRVFPGALAVEVSRERFLPVKTTDDLLVIRSDVFSLDDNYQLHALAAPPLVKLNSYYRKISDFEERFPEGPPSLISAKSLSVSGDWKFGSNVEVIGDVILDRDNTLFSNLQEQQIVPSQTVLTGSQTVSVEGL